MRRLKGAQTLHQQDSNGNLAVKLLRTFALQIEALQRYRGKGQQKVTVEHVHVNAGGQAIVGAVHAPEIKSDKSDQHTDAMREIANAPDTPLRRSNPSQRRLPIASGTRKTPL